MFVTLTVANPADILLPRQLNCNSMGKATIATTAAQLISFHRHLSLGNKVLPIISIMSAEKEFHLNIWHTLSLSLHSPPKKNTHFPVGRYSKVKSQSLAGQKTIRAHLT